MKKYFTTKRIAYLALLTALAMAFTLAVRIPIPATNGYINIGDTVVILAATLFDPVFGLIAGGLGSCLADLIGGYPHWILPTFIIKGAEGLIIGLLIHFFKKTKITPYLYVALSGLIGVIIMVAGYFIAGGIMYGSFATALTSAPANAIQGATCLILGYTLTLLLGKVNLPEADNPFTAVWQKKKATKSSSDEKDN